MELDANSSQTKKGKSTVKCQPLLMGATQWEHFRNSQWPRSNLPAFMGEISWMDMLAEVGEGGSYDELGEWVQL